MKTKKIIFITGTIIGLILLMMVLFFVYIVISSKKLNNGYNYNQLKEEITNNTQITYDELPENLINAVISQIDSDNYLLNGKENWYTKISYLILKDNGIIKDFEEVPLKSLKITYLISHTIEKDFTKEELLAYYLNKALYETKEEEIYGITAASKIYFDKEVSDLSLSECATLAAILESPTKYNPYNNYDMVLEKRNQVLEKMYSSGCITKEEKDTAKDEELVINDISGLTNYKKYTLSLKKKNQTYNIGKLHLDFEGTTYKTYNGHYQYVLNIKYDGKEIDSSFFNDKDNYRIWSHNMAADFKIYKVDEIYILVSFIAKQCFYDEIMIFNTNGEILKTYTTAIFNINDSSINIKTSDNGHCMGPGTEEHVKEYNYEISGLQLIEK